MKLTREEIDRIATLARLSLTDQEKDKFADQISVVLTYADMLKEVNTDTVEETCQVTGLEDIMREDVEEPVSEETRKKILSQFPKKKYDLLEVKAVFDNKN